MIHRLACSTLAVVVAGLAPVGAPGATPRGTRVIHVDRYSTPFQLAAGFGSVWVAEHRSYYLNRIDPQTNKIVQRIRLPDSACWPLAIGADHLWVSNCDGETGVATTYEVDPETGRVVGHVHGNAPVLAGGSLWTTGYPTPTILRYDPKTRVVLARIPPPISSDPNGMPPGNPAAGALWSTNGRDAVARVDLATNRTRVVPLPGGRAALGGGYFDVPTIVATDGRLWVPNGAGLFSLDPTTGRASLHRMRIGPFSAGGDVGIAARGPYVYLRVSDTSVVRIDARTARVTKRYRATGGGGGIVVAYGSLWVANADDDTVWREPL